MGGSPFNMDILIHRREVTDPNQAQGKNPTELKRETEFAAVLETVSQKKTVSKEERIQSAVTNAARRHNLPPELILAVIKQESNFNPVAESPCGAQGLMQLMPETAKGVGVNDPFDIDQNVDGGAGYLRQMLDQFGGDLRLALAAYNAGPGRVEQFNGIPPLEETMNYVPSVLAHYESFQGKSSHDLPQMEIASTSPLDLNLVVSVATSVRIAATPLIQIPEIKKSDANDEAPPPPPPSAVRV